MRILYASQILRHDWFTQISIIQTFVFCFRIIMYPQFIQNRLNSYLVNLQSHIPGIITKQ